MKAGDAIMIIAIEYFKLMVIASIFMLLLTKNPQYLATVILCSILYYNVKKFYLGYLG